MPTLLKCFHNTERERALPKSLYKARVIPIPKLDKDKRQTENCKPIPLMNIDANNYQKNTGKPNRIQQHIIKIIQHDQVGFIPDIQGWLNIHKSLNVTQNINRSKEKKQLIISIDAEKAFDKIQHHFMIKALMKLGIEGIHLNTTKAMYDKLITNIILNGEN
jgi:hypothetical protein